MMSRVRVMDTIQDKSKSKLKVRGMSISGNSGDSTNDELNESNVDRFTDTKLTL